MRGDGEHASRQIPDHAALLHLGQVGADAHGHLVWVAVNELGVRLRGHLCALATLKLPEIIVCVVGADALAINAVFKIAAPELVLLACVVVELAERDSTEIIGLSRDRER